MRLAPLLLIIFIAVGALAADTHPDLIVVISIDQFPYKYIPRFAPYFGDDGFNRFLKHGASFSEARYSHAITETGPGHAAIGTGNPPSRSGIVSNNWFDRLTHATVYCVSDPRVSPPFSPLNLGADTLGDRVQEKYPGAKVIGVAIKDRAAILMTGRKGTAAYWFTPDLPGFTTSTYYGAANRTMVSAYNATVPEYVQSHKVWEQTSFIPAADLQKITHDPESLRKYKTNAENLEVAFPHPIKSIGALTTSPFGNGLVISMAERVLETEQVGTADGTPDLLYVGLSSPDYIGHAFGPDSLEAADGVVRTDGDLAGFFSFLDAHFGDRYTVALTSDHGVQSIPEVAQALGRDAGRFGMSDPRKNDKTFGDLAKSAPERVQLEKRVAAGFKVAVSDETPLHDRLIEAFQEPAIYLSWDRVRDLKLDGERVKVAMRDTLRKMKGVVGAWTNSELMIPDPKAAGVELAMRNAFRADRSGDVLIALKPGWIWRYGLTGATHGQPVEDDMHVPVMLYGRGITAGAFATHAAPTDLAKTLGALLGVDAGGGESVVLPCVTK
jgi:predicted AlkP superfamily pyrophosphatase or phosphodiesterase